mgnify:CR=1 FL=1
MELKCVIYALILAGGKGTRLYPLSRMNKPKQFLKIINNKSFLENTVERITPLINKDNIYVVTNTDYLDKIKKELSYINSDNIFTEPSNKETATCIGLSAVKLLKKDNNAVMVVLPSDHHIKGEKEYTDTLLEAIELANRRRGIVTIGITPTRPETGYGYIEMGDKLQTSAGAYKISRFTEKPNIEVAKDFLLKETYLWNSGIFVFRADVILREMEKYLPKIYKSLMEIYTHIGEDDEEEVIKEQYNLIDGISIDFGIMQKTRKAYVIKGNFYWDDIGTFNALSRYLNKCSGNEISKNVYVQECENCSIFGDKNLIIGFGVKDLVIVDAGDVILVMDKNKDQEIQKLKKQIKDLGPVNINAIEDYKEVSERYEFMQKQHEDIVTAEAHLAGLMEELEEAMRRQFNEKFKDIQRVFQEVFVELFGGGEARLELTDDDVLESGIRIIAQPPGKKLQNMMQLSGGEKALTAISLLFAIQNLKPSPFCLLDEIEAALDDSNVTRFAKYLHKLTKDTQFIVITHRRGTMMAADVLYGITMQEKGISTQVSVNLIENDLDE